MTNTWNVESLMQMSTVIWRSGKNKCWVDNLRAEYLETDSTGLYVIIEKTSGFTIAAAPHFCARHELSGRIKRSSNVDMLRRVTTSRRQKLAEHHIGFPGCKFRGVNVHHALSGFPEALKRN